MKCTYLIFKIWGCFILRTSLRRIYAELDSVGTTEAIFWFRRPNYEIASCLATTRETKRHCERGTIEAIS